MFTVRRVKLEFGADGETTFSDLSGSGKRNTGRTQDANIKHC